MASRPTGQGWKHKMSYSNMAWVLDNTMVKGPDNKKALMSQATMTATQGHEGMMLWPGARVKQKRMTETSLGLTIKESDKAMAKSPEIRMKTEEVSIGEGYKGFFGITTDEMRGIEPPQRGIEGSKQMPTNKELC
jgi:hypothetical protein